MTKFENILQDLKDKQQNKTLIYSTNKYFHLVRLSKSDLELQPNPAYGTSHEVTMVTNPAYESYK